MTSKSQIDLPGLGRLFVPDARDLDYPATKLLPLKAEFRTYRYWNDTGWWGDQGQTPQCVGYAWTHWLEDGPVTQGGVPPILKPETIYHEAQKIDEWPGENYDGTSVRAGAKVLQSRGFISSYHWAMNIDEVIHCLLNIGPMVMGTNWYSSMFEPNDDNIIEVRGTRPAGGHAYDANGINLIRGWIRIKQSWGRSWANHGHAYMYIEDFERLLNENGEACIAQEVRK